VAQPGQPAEAPGRARLAGPLKILAAVAAPDETRTQNVPLDTEAEMQAVLDAVTGVAGDAQAQVRILEVASLSQIRQALVQSPETARRIYHVRLAIMIDADGRLQMARLLRSSGFPALDREIGQVVASIKINRPPPKGIPQPIRVTIIAI